LIVDTHVHVVAPDQRAYPRQLPAETAPQFGWVRTDFSAESLLAAMDDAGIDHAMLVQAYNAYRSDNRYAADMAEKYANRFTLVVCQDPRDADAGNKLDYWVKERGAVALRIMFQEPDSSFRVDDERALRLLARAEALGIPACLYMWFDQVPRVKGLLERFPKLVVALDHMANPVLDEGPPYESIRPLLDLAAYPNLYLKFSSATLNRSLKGRSTPREFFGLVLERFGAERLMWGTNFPMDNVRNARGLLEHAREQLSFLPDAVFGKTATTLWPAITRS
jgi:L-fuconolactonase